MTVNGPRDLNCATSGLRDSRYRWSSAGFAAFIGVTSVTGNRRVQPDACAIKAISRRTGIQKPDRASPAAIAGALLQNDSGRNFDSLLKKAGRIRTDEL
jgi:hypothetical protein